MSDPRPCAPPAASGLKLGTDRTDRRRLAAETAALSVVARFRRRQTIEELEVRLEEMSGTLAEVTQQIGSAHASFVGLPDQRELRWMLDRRVANRHAAASRGIDAGPCLPV